MQVHEAFTHVGGYWKFFNHSWEDGGFSVDDSGHPTHDPNRNTVGKFEVRDADEGDAELLDEAFGGVESCNLSDFRAWLSGEAGLSDATADAIAAKVAKYAAT